MKIWAHRGCSQRYPENTLTAFSKAAELYEKGLCGIELDIQLTRDGEIVVIHDERIDRTTDGCGFVKDYTLEELKTFHIHTGKEEPEHIPTIDETLDLLENKIRAGLLLNIELKNSIYPYEGMEEKIIELVKGHGFQNRIVWSSFSALSLEKLRNLLPDAEIGILDRKASDCLYKLKGGCGANAIHPFWQCVDVPAGKIKDYTVRAWLGGHLYPEKPTGGRLGLKELENKGITDVFLNEPEVYL